MNMSPQARLDRAALYLSVIQFFFSTTWVVYVVYLGDMLERVGIGREYLIWFILLDQLVFAFSDTAMGYAADKMERLVGSLGPAIIAINAVSCLAFILLPFVPDIVDKESAPLVFSIILVTWIATSSVLRAPPLVLLMKHAARPKAPRLAALSLLGLALGGAVAPYLGLVLKAVDPALPFVLTALTLALVTLGLSRVQRITRELPESDRQESGDDVGINRSAILLLLLSILFIAFGFQIHAFLNSKPLYLNYLEKEQLVWVLPLFWVGFKLLVFPGAVAARRFSPVRVLTIGAVLGSVALMWVGLADSLPMLMAAQVMAGGAWGVVFVAGISSALNLGTVGREGLVLGLWFSAISLATLARAGLVAGGLKADPELLASLQWAPPILWVLGGTVLMTLVVRARKVQT